MSRPARRTLGATAPRASGGAGSRRRTRDRHVFSTQLRCLTPVDTSDFVALVKDRHPEIADEIDALDPEPNSTLASGALARFTQKAIDAGDRATVERCFETALVAWDEGADRVQNSVGLSCLRLLNFSDGRAERSWAWSLLHPRLRDVAASVGMQPPGK